MEGFRFSTDVKVRFAETDAQGVAHNAAYLVWYEVARIAYLARFRDGYRGLQAEGYEALTTEVHDR
jgi:acyl-CoA thioester hydrolase